MSKDTIVIREIEVKDNAEMEAVIRDCFIEYKLPLEGTAYADKETTMMFESYQNARSVYYVIEQNGVVLGGGGIKALPNYETEVCEIQKMYFAPEIRGKGYGKLLFEQCLKAAVDNHFKQIYIETVSSLEAAIHIYEIYNFKHLKVPYGDTGHYSCDIWLLKDL
ncbi:GNAT family N-acetyltransferase [Bizionia gelidisalsuginis]|uniref:GNAT family N-acetyltransferase n=1 Tax=Bizionia gelidisalsuginis TaxID=291188 RepID=A0ABY3MEB6_9FLAO|nr:GNAT family N-acetyltransferase [Bizionia gelidisalsuginis]TYC17935.1 GNAT family N-acetyltransferase [Bizionia gelidisalsuginis]